MKRFLTNLIFGIACFLILAVCSLGLVLIMRLYSSVVLSQKLQEPTIYLPTHAATQTQSPTATLTTLPTLVPTQTPLSISYVPIEFAGINVSAQDVMFLSALCVVETKSFREKRDDACKSIVSTVLRRARDRVLSDGTIAGTITWNCKQGDIACQFPAYVVNGCGNIKPDMCPYNYSQHMIYYSGVVENYLRGYGEASCPYYPFYDLLEGGTDCRIEENGQYINFHDGRDQ